ncbi:MAG: 4-(cytidine 5'-diphospho)-2-C-methyl-D-erythritol kinase [Longimicrobiales bacterium]|nr:4-(cytidine 5'-diphospho)-2-C-methyl-D-erythritol kinase [Longimicrobiales bacterium]
MRITVAAPAKVNLWLRVGAAEPSGYHPVDTLFCALQLADTIVVRPATEPEPDLDVEFAAPLTALPELGPAAANLAVLAAGAFIERAGLGGWPRIRLAKRIPPGGGLGGGSSDAASVLRAMSRLHPDAVPAAELMAMAAELGSDVPFFARAAPLAHGTGRGERLASLAPLPPRSVVLVMPELAIPTAEAFRWLDEDRAAAAVKPPSLPARPAHDHDLSWAAIADRAVNDFEGPVFARHPRLAEVRDRLREHGARPALLAGSGATVFGVFEEAADAGRAAASLTEWDGTLRVVLSRTRTR